MAKLYGLTAEDRDKMRGLVRAEESRTKNPTDPAGTGSAPVLFAPCIVKLTDDIPARSGTTPGKGEGELFSIVDDVLEQNEAESTKTIYNLGTSVVSASTTDPIYALATQIRRGAFVLTPYPSACDIVKTLTGYTTAPTNPLVMMVTTASPSCPQWVAGSTCT